MTTFSLTKSLATAQAKPMAIACSKYKLFFIHSKRRFKLFILSNYQRIKDKLVVNKWSIGGLKEVN